MNNLPAMIRAYRPESFMSVHADTTKLCSLFGLTASEGFILSVLLREYQAGEIDFQTKAIRQHIYRLREKLEERYGSGTIISMGMGFYAIPDHKKSSMREDIGE